VGGAVGDNSNTQFAVLALWIARRKGIPVEAALRRIDGRFRTTQRPDGAWPYIPMPNMPGPAPPPTAPPGTMDLMGPYSPPSMTCAGLLSLAVSHGAALEVTLRTNAGGTARRPPADPSKDPVIRSGLLALGRFIGQPFARPDRPPDGPGGLPPNGPLPRAGPRRHSDAYYFLFSLERVAVAYGLDTIGDKDWYQWGADALLKSQNADGSWTGEFVEAGSDTCFALLFLRRANVAQDLTATLKGRVADPGQHQLRAVEGPEKGPAAPPPTDPEAARLGDELMKADAQEQEGVLRKLREGKGNVYTDALAHAIHRLDGAVKSRARDALADRLTRMKAATLEDKLRDDDGEVRRAAALACAMKEEKAHVPHLIELLQDQEPDVALAAHAALKSLTGQDFGPEAGAAPADVARAAAAWKGWWARNAGK
jgi:hypothetical protein